jgi:hypothetical protein
MADDVIPIVQRAYDVAVALYGYVNRFPRMHKPLLGRVILDDGLQMLWSSSPWPIVAQRSRRSLTEAATERGWESRSSHQPHMSASQTTVFCYEIAFSGPGINAISNNRVSVDGERLPPPLLPPLLSDKSY